MRYTRNGRLQPTCKDNRALLAAFLTLSLTPALHFVRHAQCYETTRDVVKESESTPRYPDICPPSYVMSCHSITRKLEIEILSQERWYSGLSESTPISPR